MSGRVVKRLGLVIGQLTYGGAEGQLYELARSLGDSHEVTVYCLSAAREPYGSRLEAAGIPVRVLEAKRNLDPGRVVRLAAALRADRIDIVHAFLYIASAYAYLATRLVRSTRLVTSARNCKIEPSLVRRMVMRRAFCASDAVICNSERMAEFAEEHYGLPASLIRVVYNGVDTRRFGIGRGGGGPRIGSIGRLEPQKNYFLFLEAASLLHRERPDVRFEIIGQGPQREPLEDELRGLGLQGVVTISEPREDIAGFLAGLDQFWLTSDWEGTPNVVLEAMAAGVPVVATSVGGTPELIEDGVNGFLVEPGSSDDLAARAGALLGDARVAGSVGEWARAAAVGRFSLEAMTEATRRVYESLGS